MRKSIRTILLALASLVALLPQGRSYSLQRIKDVASESKTSAVDVTRPGVAQTGSPIATVPNLKVAFIGDTGKGANQQAVLKLIKSEGAQAVLHQGDFDYANDPAGFWASIDSVLGPNFPYFVSVGNHDAPSWPTTVHPSYAQFLKDRMARIGVTPDRPDLNDEMYSIDFKGLKVVFVGEKRIGDSVYAPYIQSEFQADDHIWRICSWHKNMTAMQVGGKTDETGWGDYEACKNAGAIIATGHEHSYERTKTLLSIENQITDPDSPDPNRLTVSPGRTFVFVSGLGGESIRIQRRCLPTTAPYGCKGEWAKIYTSNQHAQFGALFITFNVDGSPNKAHGYFKNISGQIVDEFDITRDTNPGKILSASSASH